MLQLKDYCSRKSATHHKMIPTSVLCLILLGAFIVTGCRKQETNKDKSDLVQEDLQAKKLLQGVWVNEDDEEVAFRAKGDSIYYPDTTSVPARFYVIKDTLYMQGQDTDEYKIVKQTPHLFVFKNQNGDVIRLNKSNDPIDLAAFKRTRTVPLNQNTLIKRDTVVNVAEQRYHIYTQVNPTTYKVYKSNYNEDGVGIDNIYYDNIVHVSIYEGANRLFSRDFRKEDFKTVLPKHFYDQCILSDLVMVNLDRRRTVFQAILPIPDSTVNYIVDVTISHDGKYLLSIK